MGWTGIHATNYYHSGQINRKAECKALLTANDLCVVDSAMVGTTCYAAVKRLKEQYISAIVIITSVDNRDYFNFKYKIVDESFGPAEAKCPERILGLLSPNEDDWASDWRYRCHRYNAGKKALDALPIGAKVVVEENGEKAVYEKSDKVKKRPVWVNWQKSYYIKTDQLLEFDYKIGG